MDKTTKGSYRQNKEKLAKGENYKREIDPGIYTKKKKSIDPGTEKEEDQYERRSAWEVQCISVFYFGHRPCPNYIPAIFIIFQKIKKIKKRLGHACSHVQYISSVSYIRTCRSRAQQPKYHIQAYFVNNIKQRMSYEQRCIFKLGCGYWCVFKTQ